MNTLKKMSATALLLLGGGFVLAATDVQAVDFNINTQLTDLRSNGTNGNPGFNPCVGGARQTDGSCGNAPGSPSVTMDFDGTAHALLDKDNLGDSTHVGNFVKAGPGAITDNMFGIVSGSDLSSTPIDITSCGKFTSGATLAGLNCGDLRFDPATQGQTIPVGNNTLITPAGGLNMNTQFVADFCNSIGNDCMAGTTPAQKVESHLGINMSSFFNFQPLAGGTTATTSASDSLRQVTAVKLTGIGTLDTSGSNPGPGTGDQVFVANTSWTTTSSNNAATGPTNMTVTWHQEISDPDQSGTGSGSFIQNLDGSFVYNGTSPAIQAQYPSGSTQTQRSIGITPTSGETLDFAAVGP